MGFQEPSRMEVMLNLWCGRTIISPFFKHFACRMTLGGSEKVLELGSGSGSVTRHLAPMLPQGHLTCVDVSRVWLGLVQKRMRKFANIDYHLGEIHKLSLVRGSYDVAVLHFVLHDIEACKRDVTLKAIQQLLKVNGKIFLREPMAPEHGISTEEVRVRMEGCGFREVRGNVVRSIFTGELFDGVYEKM